MHHLWAGKTQMADLWAERHEAGADSARPRPALQARVAPPR